MRSSSLAPRAEVLRQKAERQPLKMKLPQYKTQEQIRVIDGIQVRQLSEVP